jgi:hypothetical protein
MIRWLRARLGLAPSQHHGDGFVCFVCRYLGARSPRAAATKVVVSPTQPVHICLWSSHPDLLLACDHSWTTPKWGSAETDVPDVYCTDDGRLYTFDDSHTTCSSCLEALADPVKREQAGTP